MNRMIVGTDSKECERCGEVYYRKRKPSGKMVSMGEFSATRFCSRACSNSRFNKPTQEKSCLHCGAEMTRKRRPCGSVEGHTEFAVRKFCCQACMGSHSAPGGAKLVCRENNSRRKARGLVKSELCEICGASGVPLQVHHKDKNPFNNDLGNLQVLCIPCHSSEDKATRVKKVCSVCGDRAIAKSLCSKHYMRYVKYGDPLVKRLVRGGQPVKVDE